MSITEVMKELDNIKAKHGDLDVYIQGDIGCLQHEVSSITGEEVKGEFYALISGDNGFVI